MLLLAGSALRALFAQAEKGPAKQVNNAKRVNNAKQSAIKPIPAADWPLYSRDLASTRYSPLNQISAANVSQLALAWSHANSGKVDPGFGKEGSL
jgi:glucose dehydrogenase